VGLTEQQILIDYLNSGKGVYLEGTNIAYDHQGTDFWDMFGAVYAGEGQEHGDVEVVSGLETSFTSNMEFNYQTYTYADIFVDRLNTNGGEAVFHSEEMYLRAIAHTDSNYRTICSSVLLGALSDGEGISRKVDLMRLYISYLTGQSEPDLWVSQDSIDFEYVLQGSSRQKQLFIQNSGLNELNIESVTMNNDYFSIHADASYDLQFGGNDLISINFEGTETGIFETELEFVSNDSDTPVLTIPLTVNCFQAQVISVTPDNFMFTAGENEIQESQFLIDNLGGGILDYHIQILPTSEDEESRGNGGPDNFGYFWQDSNDDQGPVFEWYDISEIGSNMGIIDINSHADLNLPFPFFFYGEVYESIAVSSNGYLTFSNFADDHSNDEIPFVIDPDNLIAPLWDYLIPASGAVYSYFDAQNYRFIVQYSDWRFFYDEGFEGLTFQAQLYPNGDIMFFYKTLGGDLTSCTVGIENQNASDGLSIVYNEEYLEDSLAVKISFQPEWITLNSYAGSVTSNDPDYLDLQVQSADLIPGVYNAEISIRSSDTHNPLVILPVSFNVDYVDADEDLMVESIKLLGNYPNPFNPTTVISYNLKAESDVTLEIYNIKGQLVRTLVNDLVAAGPQKALWNGLDDSMNKVTSGVYFYKLSAGDYSSTKKMILLK